ncbi:MAG: biopolymer transporter ExbD [Flavobacteriales bacterium]|nr:biopolymer transporter ExbD [Flavobacteriales bacterium]
MALKSRNKVDVAFNMSSMTDIVFLLLVFFIVLSTLISPYGLNVVLPNSTVKVQGPRNYTITITKDGEFALNGEIMVDVFSLEETLKQKLANVQNPGIVVKADEMVPLGIVVQIMDIANRNKYKLVIATKP